MNSERKFLHDISSPLTTLQLNIENVTELLGPGAPAECVELLAVCARQISRAMAMIKDRRTILVAEEIK